MMTSGVRTPDECDDCTVFVKFDDRWNLGYEDAEPALAALVREVANSVSDALNNRVNPTAHFDYTKDRQDITVEVGLGIAPGEWGPAWKFSIRDAIEGCSWSNDEMVEFALVLNGLAGLLLQRARE